MTEITFYENEACGDVVAEVFYSVRRRGIQVIDDFGVTIADAWLDEGEDAETALQTLKDLLRLRQEAS